MQRLSRLLLLMIIVIGEDGFAQRPGTVDPNFNPGTGFRWHGDGSTPITALLPLRDGSLLVGGVFTNYAGEPRAGLVKILENGEIDPSFVPDDLFNGGAYVGGLAELPDGQFLVSGLIPSSLLRLNSDGSVDPEFKYPIQTWPFSVSAFCVRADGRIFVMNEQRCEILRPNGEKEFSGGSTLGLGTFVARQGPFDDIVTVSGSELRRFGGTFGKPDDSLILPLLGGRFVFQSDGRVFHSKGRMSLDFTPEAGISMPSGVLTMAAQKDDKILIGGIFSFGQTAHWQNVARLNANGTLDTTFAGNPGPDRPVHQMAILPDGRAIIAGLFTSVDGLSRTGIARIFLDPPMSPSFVKHPISTNTVEGRNVRLSAAVAGTEPFVFQWLRGNEIIPNATNSWLEVKDITKAEEGIYWIEAKNRLGSAMSDQATVSLIPATRDVARLDIGYARGEGANRSIYGQAVLPNGRRAIVGDFSAFDGKLRPGLAVLNKDGTLDDSFRPTLTSGVSPQCVVAGADGKLIVGADTSMANPAITGIYRFQPDGALDTNFTANIPRSIISAILVQTDGKIVVGGRITSVNSIPRQSVARLNEDGSIDPTFDATGTGLKRRVHALLHLSDGKILIGAEDRILRVHLDGSLDVNIPLTITPTNAVAGVRTMELQPDQKILIGGNFSGIGGVPRSSLARLNPDMTVDAEFHPTVAGVPEGSIYIDGVYLFVRDILVQPDRRILVAGTFTNLAGFRVPGIGRLEENGTFDRTFLPQIKSIRTSFANCALTLSADSGGRLVVGGKFTKVNEFERNSLARLFAWIPEMPEISVSLNRSAENEITGVAITFPPAEGYDFTVEFRDQLDSTTTWKPLPGAPHNNGHATDMPASSESYYRVRRSLPPF